MKTCKGALKGAFGEQVLAPLELHTCLLEIANLVNQRPIGRVPNDSEKRWKRDIFPTLVPRRKWRIERRNFRIADVVTVTDENAVRGSWTMGRIVDVFPGADRKVRNVNVKTAKGVYSRPVTKIAVIYPAEGYD